MPHTDPDTNTTPGIRAQGRRKSNFPALMDIPADATLDFVSGGTNFKITLSDFLAALAVTGTIIQTGSVTGVPVLDAQGAVNKIRNITPGAGIKAVINTENGITLQHGFTQEVTGVPITRALTAAQPAFASLFEGNGIGLVKDGDKITITATGTGAASKAIPVNTESDFPAAVNGTITLEAAVAYIISNDITTDKRFVMQDNTSIVGFSPNIATLTYTGTGNMFTGVDTGNNFIDARLSSPNGQTFSFSETAGNAKVFNVLNTFVLQCQKYGTFSNMLGVGILNANCLDCGDGITILGAAGTLVSLERFALISTNPSFIGIDLGTSVRPIIELINLLSIGPPGAIAISGLIDSGNVSVGGLATLSGGNFLGGITEVQGVDPANDIRWVSVGNSGIADTRPDALVSLTGNALETIIAGAGTAVKVNGVFVDEGSSKFTNDATGRSTFDGERPLPATIDYNPSILMATGGDTQVTAYVAINGSIVASTGVTTTASSSKAAAVSVIWQHNFQPGDFVELFVANEDTTVNLVVQHTVGRTN